MANTTNSDDVTTLRVIVPSDAGPGKQLIVTTPDGRRVSAIVPNGHAAGSHFLVRCPPQHPLPALSLRKQQDEQYYQNPQNNNMMMKEASSSSTTQSPQSHSQSQSSPSVHKIKVPRGKRKGDKFNVTLPDGRTIVATVPQNNMTEFHIDVGVEKQKPKKQNWHDNPLAVLPMTVGPFCL